MFALSKGLNALLNFTAKCMVYLHPDKDLTLVHSQNLTRDNIPLPNNLDLTIQNVETQYPVFAYQHQIANQHPTLSMDEPRRSSFSDESTLQSRPPSTQFAPSISSITHSLTSLPSSRSPTRRITLDKGVTVNMPWYGRYRIEDYKCVLYHRQPFILIEGLRVVAPSHISTSKLYIPWENFEISHEILGWMEWIRIQVWYFTIPIHRSFRDIFYHLCCVDDDSTIAAYNDV